jgi:Domain of unknown function (DUF397)
MNLSASVAAVAISREVEAATDTGHAQTAEGKPTPEELGIDPALQVWQRSGDRDGSIEISFPLSPAWTRGDWVLMRVAGDPAGRILVFDRNEWDCFLDGVRNGEFDDAADQGLDQGGSDS